MARIQELTLSRSNRGLLVLAIAAGLVTAILVFVALADSGGGGDKTATPAAATSNVVVAQQAIPAGTEITVEMVKVVAVPDTLLVPGAFADTVPLVGEVTRYPISKGEQLSPAKIGPLVEGEGLGYVVPPGMRAVAASVKEVTAVGGLLLPGDRVDVVAHFKIKHVAGLADDEYISSVRVVLQNVEVLSVAQQNQEPLRAADTADETGGGTAELATSGQLPEDTEELPKAATVTVALSPQDVMQLISAQETATQVWLTLRAFGDSAPAEIGQVDVVMVD